jgi:hypothetical protein
MVNKADLPVIAWEESFGPTDERLVAGQIVAAITAPLLSPSVGRRRLFFVIPTPTPYANAERDLLSAIGAEGAQELRVLRLPHEGRCYAIDNEEQFCAWLPRFFRLGPPELTFIAANCELDLTASEDSIARFVMAALDSGASQVRRDVVGMHFDSGDLVELF